MVFVSAGGGVGQNGIVTIITADELVVEWITSDDGKLKTALSATSVLRFYVPWLASKASDGNGVIGFAQRDIPNGKYFAALTDGQGLGKQPATGVAITANQPLKMSVATEGTLIPVAEPTSSLLARDNANPPHTRRYRCQLQITRYSQSWHVQT